ncbi:DUF5615 family PIN-like protein [Candidatus Amarobacter glycogenicus]|uniref:DUF5615 family PIN-like protein n=1 Tax=Candidatus Amarobacter glycogenicus TaxID=3140699 RepID=UPI002A0B04BE|nr:DUF5615 family PIN-like protein [Dehalococcoidia bacterium]
MTLALYLDDDFVQRQRVLVLRSAGFVVVTPAETGTSGATDEAHLVESTRIRHVLVSHNVHDFHRLHTEWMIAGTAHGGIVLLSQGLRYSPRDIVDCFVQLDRSLAESGPANHLLFLSNFR